MTAWRERLRLLVRNGRAVRLAGLSRDALA